MEMHERKTVREVSFASGIQRTHKIKETDRMRQESGADQTKKLTGGAGGSAMLKKA